jgi:hypothetical protein
MERKEMKNHASIYPLSLITLASLAVLGACNSSAVSRDSAKVKITETKIQPLQNGMYVVAETATTKEELQAQQGNHRTLVYEDKFSGSKSPDPPLFVTLATSRYVPLVLEVPPEALKQPDGRTYLNVTLKKQHIKELEKFTRAHLGGRVAVILGGEIITMHKVRTVITGGKMMITRCMDNGCELILSKLRE